MLWTGQQDKFLKWECCQGREAFVFCSCSLALFPAHISDLSQCSSIWPPHSQFSMHTVLSTMTLLVSSQLTWHCSLSWQVLLVFSDGLDDSLEDLRKAADSLRFKGITVPHWYSSLLLPTAQFIAPLLQLFHITLPFHAHIAFFRSHWGRVFAFPCEPVYTMACHWLADDARNTPRGAEGLGWFCFLESSSSSWGSSRQPLSLMSAAPEVRPNSDFCRTKHFYTSLWALSSGLVWQLRREVNWKITGLDSSLIHCSP